MSSSIKHMVIFNLHSGKDTPEAEAFLKDSATELAAIPGVQQFEIFHQVSIKNEYDYGFSMIFANQIAYDTYNNHPVHQNYVATRWLKEVSQFQEIDFINY
ncbi:Dabb family protein [Paenibacillus crassostreae]|uniref:Stress responsive protein n=1 Tax=Paenibacillus crassostreae TaxID=1763538 RepID=A0A167BVF1_9BACL|nr:Dabb family protein [Paenibacillus crassostreae]AOZ92537.1 stress responsive protein [Paenibacillus crassostreae]OAB72485.1 stress responsive protein [Paenibacillus crassostreae]